MDNKKAIMAAAMYKHWQNSVCTVNLRTREIKQGSYPAARRRWSTKGGVIYADESGGGELW
jgi:hypothetical protein